MAQGLLLEEFVFITRPTGSMDADQRLTTYEFLCVCPGAGRTGA